MTGRPRIPAPADFPPGTDFLIKEFDVPLAWIPGVGWMNWFGGRPRPYDAGSLQPGNNWRAESFDEWAEVVAASLTPEGDVTAGEEP